MNLKTEVPSMSLNQHDCFAPFWFSCFAVLVFLWVREGVFSRASARICRSLGTEFPALGARLAGRMQGAWAAGLGGSQLDGQAGERPRGLLRGAWRRCAAAAPKKHRAPWLSAFA